MADLVVAGMAMGKAAEARVVNMSELADMLGMSLPTLRDLIKRNDDFPVQRRGDNGVAYEFDAVEVKAWLDRHAAAKADAEDRRKADLAQMRLDVFGDTGEGDETTGLSPTERRAEIEAQFRADQLRQSRGELLMAADVDRLLRQAFAELAKGLRQIAPTIAREQGLDRTVRLAMDAAIREKTNAAIDRVQELMADDDARAA